MATNTGIIAAGQSGEVSAEGRLRHSLDRHQVSLTIKIDAATTGIFARRLDSRPIPQSASSLRV